MREIIKTQLIEWAGTYNDPAFFQEDPIAFPREFMHRGCDIRDIEIAAIFSAHLAWGRRSMIVRDCTRLFDEMQWRPYDYIASGCYRDDDTSLHRTIKWSEIANICRKLRHYYVETGQNTLEVLNTQSLRTEIFGQKNDPKAANKKINMMRRWMVRRDGKVDLGLWMNTDPTSLIIPLDIHVYQQATELGLTSRRSKDIITAEEITNCFKDIWPNDPLLGDFALFGYGVTHDA